MALFYRDTLWNYNAKISVNCFCLGGKKGSFVVLNTYLILQKTQDLTVYLQIFSREKV